MTSIFVPTDARRARGRATPATRRRIARWAGVSVVLVGGVVGRASDVPTKPEGDAAGAGCRVEAVAILPMLELCPAGPAGAPAVALGGLSDLVHIPGPGPGLAFLALTDRGPNGSVATTAGRRRTLLNPAFTPSVIAIDVDATPITSASGVPQLAARTRLHAALAGRTGRPLTGLPNGIGADEPILDAAGTAVLPPTPDGVDPEGLAVLPDGSWWIAEEYRPSLLRFTGHGRAQERHVPSGQPLPGADTDVLESLPAAYGARRDNRGFEALAASPDGRTLWALLQSPLDHPQPTAAKRMGNVRLLAFDVTAGYPVREHVYRLGDPTTAGYLTKGAPPDDGKLCAMAAITATALLVIEQADDGLARLYRCDLEGVTDTLALATGAGDMAIDAIADLGGAGIVPVRKSLVADLEPLIPTLAAHVTDGAWRPAAPGRLPNLKLEGLAILDDRRIALVNDNDFDIAHRDDPREPTRRSCLWIIRLAEPLAGLVSQ
jgi:hypothetical protein